ncbi:5alpha-reductase I [Thecamonas trahens ATCC 50062]|uniref:3-oxo-5-alpha-steroid 4-dehydrogenase 1 n=1 Tax=Thecamonas trahens ATCC 50062 TaxID=461836 RepID=A0A0L0D2G1_THETB|nr:5alpha-reductase I [Thecamonas trahens ATCC 50062]KNC46340.1 5alpha-reductase I [Thecamonas trahens ATCC 50062]|eukprot:XP_013760633.1 5alpha-reductase I [Thecamonas trahens ATCC 50062]
MPALYANAPAEVADEAGRLVALAWCLLGCGAVAAAVLVAGVTAPYGRYNTAGRSWIYGWNVPGRLAWFVQEMPCVVASATALAYAPGELSRAQMALLAAFAVHYFHRACVFPFRMVGSKPSSLMTTVLAFAFCAANGYMQTRWITAHAQPWLDSVPALTMATGLVLFVVGMAINIHSDSILLNLRKPGETGYVIPRGGMFDYVSGANFFGEIVEWLGFALAGGCHLVPLSFALFTMCNIGPRALHHHAWYLTKFRDEYPRHRRALVPFVL